MQPNPAFPRSSKLSPNTKSKPDKSTTNSHSTKIKPKIGFRCQWKCFYQQDFHNLVKEKPKTFIHIEITRLSTQNSNFTALQKIYKLLRNNKPLSKLTIKTDNGNTRGLKFFQKNLKYLSHLRSLKTEFFTPQPYPLNIYNNLQYLKNISLLEIDHFVASGIFTTGEPPFSLRNLRNLRNLSIFKLKLLEDGSIQNCQFHILAKIFSQNKNFKEFTLDLARCKNLTSPYIQPILPILQNSNYSFHLNLLLHENHLTHPHNIQHSLDILSLSNPKLPLHLKFNFLLFRGSPHYASNDFLKNIPQIKSLDLVFPLSELGVQQTIEGLSTQLPNMISLQKLDLTSLGAMTQDLTKVFSSFKNLQNLEMLTLNYYSKHGNPEAIRTLAESLKNLSLLSSLSLIFSNTNLDDKGIEYLASTFSSLRALANLELNVNGCYITSTGLKKLALGLNTLSSLRTLTLSLNTKKKGVEWLCSLCRRRARSDEILLLFSALKDLTSLTKLSIDLSDSKLTAEQIHFLQTALNSLNNLAFLTLKFTYTSSEATQDFFKKLKAMKSCQITLVLSLISSRQQEVEQLCQSLESFRNLVDLELNFEKLWKMSSSDAKQLNIILQNLVNLSSLVVSISEMMILATEGGVQFTTELRNLKYLSAFHLIFPEITNYQGINLKFIERPQRQKFLTNRMINFASFEIGER